MKWSNPSNKNMARLFFFLFFIFYIMFIYNGYTMNMIHAILSLMLSIAFKTWDIMRE